MNLIEINEEIDLRKKELLEVKNKDIYEYITNFIKNNTFTDARSFSNIDIWGFLTCIYLIDSREKLSVVEDLFNNLRLIFDNLKLSNRFKIYELIKKYYIENKIDKIKDYFDGKSIIMSNSLRRLRDYCNNNNINMSLILDRVDKELLRLLKYYLGWNTIREFKNQVQKLETKSNDMKEAVNTVLDIKFQVEDEKDEYVKLDNYIREYQRVERLNRSEAEKLEIVKKMLLEIKEDSEIINYKKIESLLKDSFLKLMILKFIKEHNMRYNAKLEKEYDKLSNNSKLKITKLFNDFGINEKLYNIDDMVKYDLDELKVILKFLSLLRINNIERINIIKNTSMDIFNSIHMLFIKDIINIDFLSNNIDIFYRGSFKINNLKNNINILRDNNINIEIFNNNMEILLNDSNIIYKNLLILKEYSLLEYLNENIDYNFLLNSNLELVIDKYLEMGLEEYLKNNLNILNNKDYRRVELLKLIGIDNINKEDLDIILNNSFNIEQIDSYLPVDNKYIDIPNIDIDINSLDNYKCSNLLYNFDGILISILKVNRMINKGYNIINAIIYNTNMVEDDINKIINLLNKEYNNSVLK